MNKVNVLIEGYVRMVSDTKWEASSTVTLITTNKGKLILVDPGSNKKVLTEKLRKQKVAFNDIDWVFITHHHPDHMKNIALFPHARLIDVEGIYYHDQGEPIGEFIPGTDIAIIKTPGHEHGHASLLVPTNKGTIAVAGDVFWFMEGEQQMLDIDKKDDFATDINALKNSRKLLLEKSDWIIPGHGKMMKV